MENDIKDAIKLMKEHIETCRVLSDYGTKEQREFEAKEKKRYENALEILQKIYKKEL